MPNRQTADYDPGETLAAIARRKPLVHAITNALAVDLTANLLLAVGASPVMARAPEEAPLVAGRADALLLNIGMLGAGEVELMAASARAAAEAGRPWVLDPVGVGTTPFRSEAARRLLDLKPTVVRGNAAEIGRLGGLERIAGRGVDSETEPEAVLEAARALARETGGLAVVTGPTDWIADGERFLAVRNGHPLMTRLSGLGCALGALIAAALSARPGEALAATAGALALLGVAGQQAAGAASGPGSFRPALLDSLFSLDPAELNRAARIAEETPP